MEPTGITLLAASAGHAVAFYLLSALAIAAALVMVVQKNPVASVLWLVLAFIGLAGLFLLMQAYFLAIVQVLVYAGAIMVLFLFVIMLLDMRTDAGGESSVPEAPVVGLAGAALFLVAMVMVLGVSSPYFEMPMETLLAKAGTPEDSVREVGVPLFQRWLLPFEVVSVLLLTAIVGAVALTKKRI